MSGRGGGKSGSKSSAEKVKKVKHRLAVGSGKKTGLIRKKGSQRDF